MTFRIVFAGTVAKHIESSEDNEDAYHLAQERGRVVLSDGASESFDARNWASILVDQFLNRDPSEEALFTCIETYERLHDPSTLSWSKAAAYNRGSFATLLIAQDDPVYRTITVTSLGDGLAVWSNGSTLLETAPYTYAHQFTDKPTLLSTRRELNPSVTASEPGSWCHRVWSYDQQESCLLLCMTDALGAWLLIHQEQGDSSAFERLCNLREQQEFVELVETERASGRLRRDDTTLILITMA